MRYWVLALILLFTSAVQAEAQEVTTTEIEGLIVTTAETDSDLEKKEAEKLSELEVIASTPETETDSKVIVEVPEPKEALSPQEKPSVAQNKKPVALPAPKATAISETSYQKPQKPISSTAFLEARQLYKAGELEPARKVLKASLNSLSGESRDKAEDLLAEINNKLMFESKSNFPGIIEHKVKPGESLYVIAKKYKTTPEFIAALNNVKGTIIYPDQKLRVASAPIFINVSKSKNRMQVYLGEEIIRTYPVATGTDNSSPVGTFTVTTKIENPTWYKTGAVIPPGDKENILGSRWLGFSLTGYGIHGTTIPESIGTQSTAGCVRMLNQDVEETYAIVPLGSTVTIAD